MTNLDITPEQYADDESVASCETTVSDGHRAHQEEARKTLAHRENQAVGYLRVLVYLVVLITALIVCFLVYYFTRSDEEKSFEDNFLDYADKLME
jgi:multisubunit Na+/H+ antiporter MnhB subunit